MALKQANAFGNPLFQPATIKTRTADYWWYSRVPSRSPQTTGNADAVVTQEPYMRYVSFSAIMQCPPSLFIARCWQIVTTSRVSDG
jgi:hypothetical protein